MSSSDHHASAQSPSTKRARTSKKAVIHASSTGILDYLRSTLPRQDLLELYQDDSRGRYVCRFILQRLPETSQQIILRLSSCGGSFPTKLANVWTKSAPKLEELEQWGIIIPNRSDTVELTPEFFKGLRDSLNSLDDSPWNPLKHDEMILLEQEATRVLNKPVKFPAMTTEDLERYTQTEWDAILHYLVGTPTMKVQQNLAVRDVLLQTNLMQLDLNFRGSNPDNAPLVTTPKGYDFILQDNSKQVWLFVVQCCLQGIERKNNEKAAALKRETFLVLICMSFARLGECYSAAALSDKGRIIMKELAKFGLLYVKEVGKTAIFYPTRLAMQLVGGEASSKGGAGMWCWTSKALDSALAHPEPEKLAHLAIIVQTNFQLCAYTTSDLHVSILGLFCDMDTIRRLPNAVFMVITRASIKSAFSLGFQAPQILRFLEKHAHPKLRQEGNDNSPLPPNIVDRIFLWDRERRDRVIAE